jgi:Leucine-rich repeat (LRR) protein
MNDNELGSLPNSIGKLKNIQQLSLHNNKFENLPGFVGELPQLRQLSLDKEKMNERSKQVIENLIDRGIQVRNSC